MWNMAGLKGFSPSRKLFSLFLLFVYFFLTPSTSLFRPTLHLLLNRQIMNRALLQSLFPQRALSKSTLCIKHSAEAMRRREDEEKSIQGALILLHCETRTLQWKSCRGNGGLHAEGQTSGGFQSRGPNRREKIFSISTLLFLLNPLMLIPCCPHPDACILEVKTQLKSNLLQAFQPPTSEL